jgi:peroxidase
MGQKLRGAACSMLVLSALLALAASQPPAPSTAANKPSSPPTAVPAPRASRPPAPAPRPSLPLPAAPAQKPAPTVLPSPTTAPAARLPSHPPASPTPPAPRLAPKPSQAPASKQSPVPVSPPPSPRQQPPSPSTSWSLGQLSTSYYALSCPSVELAVRDVVRSASTIDPTIPGKLLRMVFHDCFVEVWGEHCLILCNAVLFRLHFFGKKKISDTATCGPLASLTNRGNGCLLSFTTVLCLML